MPGLFSSVFDDGDAGSGPSSHAQHYEATVEGGQAIAIDQDVTLEVGGTYQNADGSTTTWSNSQHVGIDGEIDATVVATLILDTGETGA